MQCSVVIVSYNTFEYTRSAVQSVVDTTDSMDVEVIVVDNASPDESAKRLQEAFPGSTFPNVHVVANQENAGFSRANNVGASQAHGDVLFFLNPDTIVHSGAMRALYTFLMDHPEIGAVGPRVYNADGTDQKSFSDFPNIWKTLHQHFPVDNVMRGHDQLTVRTPKANRPVDVVAGCALAIRRDAFDAVGGWDEQYFMYAEESELCYALHQAGYMNYYLQQATITHYGQRSSSQESVNIQLLQQQSSLQFLRRHHGRAFLAVHRISGVVGYALRAAIFPVLSAFCTHSRHDFAQRGKIASRLWRWYALDYE